MKLAKRNIVVSNATGEVTNFDLSAMDVGHITNILRKQIYTQHDLAVIREYITNALDEHVTHRPTQPVLLDLPNKENEYTFSVRDYGQGLSPDDIKGLYIQYGASTKRDSNAVAGALGIGCKAWFAYGDMFYIESYHDNQHHKYMAALSNETGQLHHISSERIPTNIPHGMQISGPVKEDDVYTFNTKIIKYLNYIPKNLFKIRYQDKYDNLIQEHWTHNEEQCRLSSEPTDPYPWAFYKSNPMSTNNGVVVMGNVPYPIEAGNMDEDSNEYLKNEYLVVQAPLGSLSIAANREQLQYDDRTKMTLAHLNKKIQDSVTTRIQCLIDDSGSYSRALKTFQEGTQATAPNVSLQTYRSNNNFWEKLKNYTWNKRVLVRHDPVDGNYLYMHHTRKTAYSSASKPAYTWEGSHRTSYASTTGPDLVNHHGETNKFILWNPDIHTETRMKQLVGYHHRQAEDTLNSHELNTWWVLSPSTTTTYDSMKTSLKYYGELIVELSDLGDIPRAAPTRTITDSSGTVIGQRTEIKNICLIDNTESKIHDRLVYLDQSKYDEATVFKIDDLDNEHSHTRLAFPYKSCKLLYPDETYEYPIQTCNIGTYDTGNRSYYNCPITNLLKTLDPELQFNQYKISDSSHLQRVRYYAIPTRKSLPEGFTWVHDFILDKAKDFIKTKDFAILMGWNNLKWEDKQKITEHPMYSLNWAQDRYSRSSSSLVRKLNKFENIIRGNTSADNVKDTLTQINEGSFKKGESIKLPKKNLNLTPWVNLYNKAMKQFPLAYHLAHSHYLGACEREQMNDNGFPADYFKQAKNKYFKIQPIGDAQD